jgi:hypothetical protein
VSSDLNLSGNTSLTSFSLPALTTVSGALIIDLNTALPECAALALLERLAGLGFTGSWSINGNNKAATCP